MNFAVYEKHQHTTDKIARAALKKTAKAMGLTYAEVLKAFRIEQNLDVTEMFWWFVNSEYPNKFHTVDYCMTCRKFNLGYDPGMSNFIFQTSH